MRMWNNKSSRGDLEPFRQGSRSRTPYRNSSRTSDFSGQSDSNLDFSGLWIQVREENELDEKFGFRSYLEMEGTRRTGWLLNMHPTLIEPKGESAEPRSAIHYYFMQNDGSCFKATKPYYPYLYLEVVVGAMEEVEAWIRRRYPRWVDSMLLVPRLDLSMPNHQSGTPRTYIRVQFRTVQALVRFKSAIHAIIQSNEKRQKVSRIYGQSGMRVAADSGISSWSAEMGNTSGGYSAAASLEDATGGFGQADQWIMDIREHDVPYYVRQAIDHKIRVGRWYDVFSEGEDSHTVLTVREDLLERPAPRVLAFDIETTKLPLRFPDAKIDAVMMISYMIDGQGYLIINREIIAAEIDSFEYTPKPEYPGPFIVWNEKNEEAVLRRFFKHIQERRPNIYSTFNGDAFDWPFIVARSAHYGINLYKEIGVAKNMAGEYVGRICSHMDAYRWVVRDSYLPHGSHGLKAVTKQKLGYDPLELDPEEMLPMARKDPQRLSNYSVSDAVATYFLYMIYVHPFIYSLCNVIPMNPDDVLRKGSGTLCEMLLMAEAFNCGIIFPNKSTSDPWKSYRGHLLESETYVGGRVESLQSGVYRSDLRLDFELNADLLKHLAETVVDTIYDAAVEGKLIEADNFDTLAEDGVLLAKENILEVKISEFATLKDKIQSMLLSLAQTPDRSEKPVIYHVDVAAMYPNIILTNRLQPTAIVNPEMCAVCDYNRPGMKCQRAMEWVWRGDFIPTTTQEMELVQNQLEVETFAKPKVKSGQFGDNDAGEKTSYGGDVSRGNGVDSESNAERDQENDSVDVAPQSQFGRGVRAGYAPTRVRYSDMDSQDRLALLKQRLKEYAYSAYGKRHETQEVVRTDVVCMREHAFYVDTVRSFRDRRYQYKEQHKQWKNNLDRATNAAAMTEAQNMIVLFDSLQLAHKCILNSFYGYVMRRGARWYSMEMAGIVTRTGALIIQKSREVINGLGIPLELDTDGIWCCLPSSFPQNFEMCSKANAGRKYTFSYPCVMLNGVVSKYYSNDQYHHITYPAPTADGLKFQRPKESVRRSDPLFDDASEDRSSDVHISKECSILFELDGPYGAMILPASRDEDKNLKKRYAVFHPSGRLAELKGFEVKRRGELKLIKIFQGDVFEKFLEGKTLKECYAAVASVANQWLDVLFSKGSNLPDDELIELISESKNMSRQLEEYGGQKSVAITTARRLADFLGDEYVREKGLACKFIISKKPAGVRVTDRALPIAIFQTSEKSVRAHHLRRWCKDPSLSLDVDIRDLVDWNYYVERLSSAIQKIITIPAALQHITNPVPRVPHPVWLEKRIREETRADRQRTLNDVLTYRPPEAMDIEDAMKGERVNRSILAARQKFNESVNTMTFGEKRKSAGKKNGKSALPAVITEIVDDPTDTEFDKTLKRYKVKWRNLREARMARKMNGFASGQKGENRSVDQLLQLRSEAEAKALRSRSLRDYVASQLDTLIVLPWDIVAVDEWDRSLVPSSGNALSLWILVGGTRNQRVVVDVPFSIYVHWRKPSYFVNEAAEKEWLKSIPGERVDYTLPHGKNMEYLTLVTLPKKGARDILDALRSDVEKVEGIYEAGVPASLRAFATLGCRVGVKPDSRRKYQSTRSSSVSPVFALADLERVETSDQLRLCPVASNVTTAADSEETYSDRMSHLQYVYIYASRNGDHRGLIACSVGLPTSPPPVAGQDNERITMDDDEVSDTSTPVWTVFLAHPMPASDDTERLTRIMCRRLGPSSSVRVVPSPGGGRNRSSLWPDVVKEARAWILETVKSRISSHGTTVVLLQSSLRDNASNQSLDFAVDDLPVWRVPANDADNVYQALGWELDCVRLIAARRWGAVRWLNFMTRVSQVADIPVSILGTRDWRTLVMDINYARALSESHHLLWISSGANSALVASNDPVTGKYGDEEDGDGLLLGDEGDVADDAMTATPASGAASQNAVIGRRIHSGCFRTLCVELQVHGLAIHSVVGAPAIHALEGISEALRADDEARDVWGVLRVLRSLVGHWMDECSDRRRGSENDRRIVRGCLAHVLGWLTQPQSLLYDGKVASALSEICRKTMARIAVRAEQLGCHVIAVCGDRLWLDTGKTDPIAASRFITFLCSGALLSSTNRSSDMKTSVSYTNLNISWLRSWSSLVFVDEENYGGVVIRGLGESTVETSAVTRGDSADFIVEVPHHGKGDIVAHWSIVSQCLPERIHEHAILTLSGFVVSLQEDSASGDEFAESFTSSTLRLVDQVRRMESILGTEWQKESTDAGGDSNLLEPFMSISSACAQVLLRVFSLDAQRPDAVQRLRVAIWTLLGIQPFSEEALSFRALRIYDAKLVVTVVCPFCALRRDVDLIRNVEWRQIYNSHAGHWPCPSCNQPIAMSSVEQPLANSLSRRFAMYMKQDPVCVRCHWVVAERLSKQCAKCGSDALVMRLTAERLLEYARRCSRVARVYTMLWLREVSTWIINELTS